jgi:hypothetical protein
MMVASGVQAVRGGRNPLAHLFAAFSCTGFGGMAGQAIAYVIRPGLK